MSAAGFVALRAPAGVLGRIVARTVAEVGAAADLAAADGLAAAGGARRRGHVTLWRALADVGQQHWPPRLIAEVKPRSPSRGALLDRADVPAYVDAVAPHAAAISVLVDEIDFGGGFALLGEVRARTDRPLLAKGFFVSHAQIAAADAAGADAVLLMASVLRPAGLAELLADAHGRGMDALVEAHNADEIAEARAAGARIVGVNARDLATLAIDRARARALLAALPANGSVVRVAESGLGSAADIAALEGLAEAVLIGSALVASAAPAATIAALGLSGLGGARARATRSEAS